MALAPYLDTSVVLADATRHRKRALPSAALMVATCVAAVSLVPVGFIVFMGVTAGLDTVIELVFRARVGELLINTLLLQALAIPLSAALALALAWLTERTDMPFAYGFAWLAVTPLAVPAFVHSYAWVSLMPNIHGLPGALLVSVLAYFPFIYLPVAAQLRRLDPALEEVAGSLGLSPIRVFFRTVLPQLHLSLCGGCLLVGLHLLSEYGVFAMLRFDTFSTAIVDQFQSSFGGPAANMLAGVLVILSLGLLGGEHALRGNARYARIGGGSVRPAARRSLGTLTLPCLLLAGGTALLALGVPVWMISRWLVAGGLDVWSTAGIGTALAQTTMLALAGGLLTTLAATSAAWLSVRQPGRFQRILESCHYIVGSIPGAVVGLALVMVTISVAKPLYQSYLTLLVGYGMLFLPRALVGLRASLAQAPRELEDAAVALGRSPRRAILSVTMRLAAPGIAASVCLAALGIVNELTVTLMLAPNGTSTLATRFWALTSEIDYAAAAPHAFMMVVLSLPMTVLLFRQSRKAIGQ